ncbi:MAG: CDF family Co(II)/Ni(II) efflux transporter DmeF, partial [Thermoanaerobaculales bacterium]|nr:CDF family Co(II)/Ni(II) efflux transporter DmeF [Thermoanaerobaculales bacterium]
MSRGSILQHEHHFDQHLPMSGEARTRWVVAMTAVTMVVEIAAGVVYGSMALLADGLHMASHAAALGLSAFAYAYARRHAHDNRFSFGTGKVNSLAGFASAVVLVLFAVMMVIESVRRFLEPVPIAYNQAIVVAVLGLIVNGISVFILREGHDHGHGHGHHEGDHHHDHNLRAAHLHVLADALTSILAIAALLAAKIFGVNWMDPAMGIVGGVLVARWSWGLMRTTSRVLLDQQLSSDILDEIRTALGKTSVELVDLHVWEIGPGYRAAIVAVETSEPINPEDVKKLVPEHLGIAHLTVEIYQS